MNRRIIVLEEAEDELSAAEDWYERQQPGLGRAFRSAVDDAMERLLRAPLAASPVIGVPHGMNIRRVLIKRFPYPIVFIEHANDFWIVAFAHHQRRPGYWLDRLNEPVNPGPHSEVNHMGPGDHAPHRGVMR